ncbi:protein PIN-LIKES 2 isoform X3 [Ricinus communis]|uniref:protein PIN-LIKES 2 isoform X3 n=1 Tax=Ricinus communis TaxID=3988 RepID=UPI00201AF407|nr:protein PIN-LIKES 2 isoform X3 [Ricinus communis]
MSYSSSFKFAGTKMESVLFALQEKVKNEGEDITAAIVPLLKLITLTLFGFILIKYELIPKPTLNTLSKLVFVLFLPCLIFTHLGPPITLHNIVRWWFIPVNVLLSTAIGCVLGYLVALICRPPPEFFRFTIIMTGFGNTVGEIEEISIDDSRPLLVEAEFPGLEDQESEHSKTPFIARLFNGVSERHVPNPDKIEESSGAGEEEEGDENSPKSIACLVEPRMVSKIRVVAEQTPIHHVLQPPTIASLLAIIIGVIPAVKKIVYGTEAPLEFMTDSLDILSEAMVPSVMLILGGLLAEGPTNYKLGTRTTIGVIVARLLVLPAIGIGVIYLADRWNLLISGDLMYRFVLLLQYTTPSAILLGAVASLRGYAVKEASALLFWQHACAVVSLSAFILLYFHLLLLYV